MRTYWLQYLLNLVLPLALIFFAWGCGGVAIQVDAPHKTPAPTKLKKPRPTLPPKTPQPRRSQGEAGSYFGEAPVIQDAGTFQGKT